MSPNTLFIIIVSILVFSQVFNFIIDALNDSYRNHPIPDILNDVYDEHQYKQQQKYNLEKSRISFLSASLSFTVIILALFFDGFALLDNYIREYINNEILISLIFFAILMMLSTLLNLPFSIYNTFVIEEKYGFNKTTVQIFVLDILKGALLSALIGGLLLYLILLSYHSLASSFWIFAWLLITVFMVFMNMFYSQLIVPLFNKQTPLEEGELREGIEVFSQKVNFKLDNIFVIDGSKRSTKANAYFSGLGHKKRIVLYDTLIKDLSKEEILAVLAHEIGHYKHKHSLKGMIISVLQTGFILFLFSLLIDNPILNEALGSEHQSFHFGMLVFGFLFEPISLFIGIITNIISRENEYQADNFAQQQGLGEALVSGLKQLSRTSLSNLTPHPWYIFVHYSHPSLFQRAKALGLVSRE